MEEPKKKTNRERFLAGEVFYYGKTKVQFESEGIAKWVKIYGINTTEDESKYLVWAVNSIGASHTEVCFHVLGQFLTVELYFSKMEFTPTSEL